MSSLIRQLQCRPMFVEFQFPNGGIVSIREWSSMGISCEDSVHHHSLVNNSAIPERKEINTMGAVGKKGERIFDQVNGHRMVDMKQVEMISITWDT